LTDHAPGVLPFDVAQMRHVLFQVMVEPRTNLHAAAAHFLDESGYPLSLLSSKRLIASF
jgi:hypothetical protein